MQAIQPRPRILLKEPHGDVIGGAAPRLDGQQLGCRARNMARGGNEVVGADARGQQRLVRIAERRIGHGNTAALAQLLREFFGPELQEAVA